MEHKCKNACQQRHRSSRRLGVSIVFSLVLLTATVSPAAASSADATTYLTNWLPAPGYPTECALAILYFTSPPNSRNNAVISWGGSCNQSNARPPGWLQSNYSGYSGGLLCANSSWIANADWSSVLDVTYLDCQNGMTLAVSQSVYWLSTVGRFQYSRQLRVS